MSFAVKLQTLRKEKGFSQEKLAEKLDVSRQAVSKWELGQCYPETEKLMQLCQLFDVSMDELVADKEASADAQNLLTVQSEQSFSEIPDVNSDKAKKLNIFISAALIVIVLILELLAVTVFQTTNGHLVCRVLSRGVLGLMAIYNGCYLTFTKHWSFLYRNTKNTKRRVCGIILLIVGLIAVITALMGFGSNGDPRLKWWE